MKNSSFENRFCMVSHFGASREWGTAAPLCFLLSFWVSLFS